MENTLVIKSNQVLTKVARRIENECGIKNADFLIMLGLMIIDPKEWKFDRAWLTRVYKAMDIIEHNEELKQLFQQKCDTDTEVDTRADEGAGNNEASLGGSK